MTACRLKKPDLPEKKKNKAPPLQAHKFFLNDLAQGSEPVDFLTQEAVKTGKRSEFQCTLSYHGAPPLTLSRSLSGISDEGGITRCA